MKALAFAFVIALVACGPKPAPKRAFAPADRDAVKALLEMQVAAWNKGDFDGYMAGYARTDWIIFTSGAKIRRGWQTTYDTFRDKYAKDPSAMGKLQFEILSIDPIGADGVVVLGNWTLTNSPADGGGVFSVVLERRPDGWKIIHDHTSAHKP